MVIFVEMELFVIVFLFLSFLCPLLFIWDGYSNGSTKSGVIRALTCYLFCFIGVYLVRQMTLLILLGVPMVVIFLIPLITRKRKGNGNMIEH